MTDREDTRDPREVEEEQLALGMAALDPDMGLITAYLDDELPDDQRQAVEQRLETDAAFRRRAEPFMLAERVRLSEPVTHDELLRSWLQVRQRAGMPDIPGYSAGAPRDGYRPAVEWQRRPRGLTMRKLMLAAAAVIVLAIGVPLGAARYQLAFNYQKLATEGNVTQVVTLPDGSRMTLAGGTRARYRHAMATRQERVVYLDGEATFEVVTSPRPFIVIVDGAQVTVQGTSFTVHAYGSEPVVVSVRSGTVQFESRDGDGELFGALVLSAGQRARGGWGIRPEVLP